MSYQVGYLIPGSQCRPPLVTAPTGGRVALYLSHPTVVGGELPLVSSDSAYLARNTVEATVVGASWDCQGWTYTFQIPESVLGEVEPDGDMISEVEPLYDNVLAKLRGQAVSPSASVDLVTPLSTYTLAV